MGLNAGAALPAPRMNTDSDVFLMRQYVRHGSQAAFGALVRRYGGLVHATCLREVDDPALAEDAAQVVFLLLARRAPSLLRLDSLAGWLFRAARFCARNALRQERRRKVHEQEVMADMTRAHLNGPPLPSWDHLEPLLNAALAALRPQEQEVVLLRYLEGASWRETAARLGLAEDAAQKRGTRAVDKMRRFVNTQGLMLSLAALMALLSEEAARAVPLPAAVAAKTVAAAANTGVTAPNVASLFQGVLHMMKMTKVATALGGITLTGAVGGLLLAQSAPKPQTPLQVLGQVRAHYQGLTTFSMSVQHYGDTRRPYLGPYTQQLQWQRGGRFELRNTSPQNKALPEGGDHTAANEPRAVPDFVADGTQVACILPRGNRWTEQETPRPSFMPGWEITGGEITGWLQDTPTSQYYFSPPTGMMLTWSFGPRTVWRGLRVRELQAHIANHGHIGTFYLFLNPSATMLLGTEGEILGGKPGYTLYLDQKENPPLPATLGNAP